MQCLEYTDKVRAWQENDGDLMAASDTGMGGVIRELSVGCL